MSRVGSNSISFRERKRGALDRAADRVLALEIAASSAVGDHEYLSRPALRAVYGFVQLLLHAAVKSRVTAELTVAPRNVVFVVANPVAHGARLARAVRGAVGANEIVTVADSRFAESELIIDYSFPGVSPISLRNTVTVRGLMRGVQLRRMLPSSAVLTGSTSRGYREYLFLAQSIRYFACIATLSDVPRTAVVLTDFDRSAYARPWVWAAKAAGLASATLMHGSPNAQNYIPVLANHAFVWGDVQKNWVARMSPQTAVDIIGRPDLSDAGVGPLAPIQQVIVCHSREVLTDSETSGLIAFLSEARASGAVISLRVHPTSAGTDFTGGWANVAAVCDQQSIGRGSLIDALTQNDLVVCVTSTSAVDALVIGVPAVVIADPSRALPADLEAIRVLTPKLLEALRPAQVQPSNAVSLIQQLRVSLVADTGAAASVNLGSALAALRTTAPTL